MSDQVQVMLDKRLYNRLLELEVPPYNDVSAVIDRLLYHAGRPSREAVQLESEERHYTMEDELRRASEGIYAGSGIAP
jgi:hypothetical protein